MQNNPVTLKKIALEALDGGDNLLQSGFWGAHKERFGWAAHAFVVGSRDASAGDGQLQLLVLRRNLGAGQSIAYVPHGPDGGIEAVEGSLLAPVARELLRALPAGTLFVRFDLPGPVTGGESAPVKAAYREALPGLVPASSDVQPASTVVVDLTPEPDGILSTMKSKTRYNIRLAERRGVEVMQGGPTDFDLWYELYRETARRDRIAIHAAGYYRALFELSADFAGRRPEIRLYMASHDGDLLAGVITAFYGRRATYLYGASSNDKRNLMPAYLLQWRAMQDARDFGCSEYDLFGIPPSDDPAHPMSGLYRFKSGFGGRVIHRPGCWDLSLKPVRYGAYRLAERARAYYFHQVRKRGRGERS